MKTRLLIFLFMGGMALNAQNTHQLDWYMGISVEDASLEIEEGDTVIWTITDSAPHTVTSDAGSTESFESGTFNQGETFEYTFTQQGSNAYHCGIHPSMQGVITVNPSMGVNHFKDVDFAVYPNPSSTQLNLQFSGIIGSIDVQVYDLNGKTLFTGKFSIDGSENAANVDVSNWSSGVYIVEFTQGEAVKRMNFIKK
ncbi:MAG TPA: T9SS type A sorting domain-containing protein [Salinimicrobium sp.]|nr:T9SS type A sorting domain-containing protein [Salinimicrobium sp.]